MRHATGDLRALELEDVFRNMAKTCWALGRSKQKRAAVPSNCCLYFNGRGWEREGEREGGRKTRGSQRYEHASVLSIEAHWWVG